VTDPKPFYLSKKWWAAFVGFAVVTLQLVWPGRFENLDPAQIAGVIGSVLPVVGYLFAQGQVDAARVKGDADLRVAAVQSLPPAEPRANPYADVPGITRTKN